MSDPPLPPTAPWIIRFDELHLEDDAHLAGCIAQGRWRNTLVIVKALSKQAEASLWTSLLPHPNVLQIFGVSPSDADPLYLVNQFQPNGNVLRFLQQSPQTDRSKIVPCGMQYLHAHGVVHGSLKPTNVLVDADGTACVSDCGMVEVQTSASPGHRYFSPEAWKGTISRPSDVFAWAMVALEIFTGKAPWGILSEEQIFHVVVRQDSRPDRPDEDLGITDHIWGIMEECWHRESRLRPTFDILVQLLQNSGASRIQPEFHASGSSLSTPHHQLTEEPDTSNRLWTPPAPTSGDNLASLHAQRTSYTGSVTSHGSVPPAYEVLPSTSQHPGSAPPSQPLVYPYPLDQHPGSAPPTSSKFSLNHSGSASPFQPQFNSSGADQYPGSAPPTVLQFEPYAYAPPAIRSATEAMTPPRPQYAHNGSGGSSSTSLSPNDNFDEDGMSPMFNSLNLQSPDTTNTPWSPGTRLGPASSVRTSSSRKYDSQSAQGGSSAGSSSRSQNSRTVPSRLRTIDAINEEPYPPPQGYESARTSLAPTARGYSLAPPPRELKHTPSTVSTFPSEYTPSTARAPSHTYVESVRSESNSSGGTAPNANLLAGALLAEVKEGRKREVIDGYLDRIQKLGLRSHKDAQKLVTAGTIPTLILLLKSRAVEGDGLETVLLALGILTHDPITANTIYRTSTSATLIEILDAARSDDIAALAVWCLARICRSAEVANGLLKLNLAKLLVTKGLKGGQRTARISAWCLGALIRSDSIAESLAEMGLVAALCEHMRRCSGATSTGPDDYSSILYAAARLSRSIKISKALAKGGCVEMLAHFFSTTEDPQVLLWAARCVGCLVRPNGSEVAKILLDAGIARGLARLPSMLATEEVEPLGAFAFAIQRFSCAEWGGGTRKALVEAGVVDALLASLRTAADEPYPQVHIELAYAIALLGDVGGTAIRKEIMSAGGIEILKRVGTASARADVTKACNLAATSITGNVWSRNAGSWTLWL
ncbi:hypothetical protein B0H15DRAFT_805837 [Mycena belliarum]|uniref:Protein kinase domain-containing protein n=1 Tax=Mycena belliarum TaxID=1033014 RepID=A0AAD6TRA8_9AGAR|nr:hypothetical protein B0H15DRAFT_805837 [Mycena belliae]